MPGKRLWYPTFLIDEVLPEGRDSAEAWLTFLLPDDQRPDLDEDECALARGFGPGDIIDFRWMEARGDVALRIRRDGSLHTPLRCTGTVDMFVAFPPAMIAAADPAAHPANHWWNADHEAFGETVEQFAEAMATCAEFDEDGFAEVEAETYFWSDKITYRISADGRSLLPVEHQPAAPEQQEER